MRAMYCGTGGDHVLVDHSAEEGVAACVGVSISMSLADVNDPEGMPEEALLTQLISLPKPHLSCQESCTLIRTRIQILFVRHGTAITIRHRCLANAPRKLLRRVRYYLGYCQVVGGRGRGEEVVDSPLPPSEGGVVLRYLTKAVEGVPGFDLDREGEAGEDGEGEVESASAVRYISNQGCECVLSTSGGSLGYTENCIPCRC